MELRLKIWRFHIQPNEPGIVEVSIKHVSESLEYCRVIKWRKRSRCGNLDIRPLSPIPAVLHVCKESRMEAMRYYKLGFGHKAWHPSRTYLKYPPNSSSTVDTICLHIPQDRSPPPRFSMHTERMAKIRAAAVACINEHDVRHLGLFMRRKGNSPRPMDILSHSKVFILMKSCVETLDVIVDSERGLDACATLFAATSCLSSLVLVQLVNFMEVLKKSNRYPPDQCPSFAIKTLVRASDEVERGKKSEPLTLFNRLGTTWRNLWLG